MKKFKSIVLISIFLVLINNIVSAVILGPAMGMMQSHSLVSTNPAYQGLMNNDKTLSYDDFAVAIGSMLDGLGKVFELYKTLNIYTIVEFFDNLKNGNLSAAEIDTLMTSFKSQIESDIAEYKEAHPNITNMHKDEWAFNYWVLDKLFFEDEEIIESKIIDYSDYGTDAYEFYEDTKDIYLIQNKF